MGKGPTRLACRALYRSLSSNPQRAGRVLPKLGEGVIRALTPDLKVVLNFRSRLMSTFKEY